MPSSSPTTADAARGCARNDRTPWRSATEPLHEITLSDLLAWEPRLEWLRSPPPGWRDRDVSWAVVARASAPMLAPLHGGEIVILPRSGVEASGSSWIGLLRELVPHGPAAVLVDAAAHGAARSTDIPLLVLPGVALTSDLESRLNRLLAERRGELYRTGTALGQVLTAAPGRGADVAQVLQIGAESTGLAMRVCDRTGRAIARGSTTDDAEPMDDAACVERTLADGHRLVIWPVAPDRHAAARLVAERMATALNDALLRAAELQPRGAARAQALAELLCARAERNRSDIESLGRRLGLAIDATYRVALIGGDALAAAPDWLRESGSLQGAGRIAGADAYLLECRDRGGDVRPAPANDAPTAVSGPAFGVAALSEATRQARFVLALLEAGSLARPVAQFDRPGDLHAYRLLYEIWGSPAAERFAHDLVGDLRLRDRRGDLRQTLLAFLASGGSHVEAARRLGIHRNTLAYRLRQIDRALGRDARQGDGLLGLHLALLVDALPPVGEDGSKRPIDSATG